MAARTRTSTSKAPAASAKPKAPGSITKVPAKDNARTPTGKPEVRIFVSYSHVDAAARTKLETHLAPLTKDGVSTWFDGRMDPGDALDAGISRALRQAHIMVALLSPEYISSRYCQLEYERAMGRRARGTMRVVAVVVRPCGWKETSAAGFKLLPEDGRTVLEWRSADAAFLNVAQGIGKLVRTVRAEMADAPTKPRSATPKVKAVAKANPSPAVPKPKPRARATTAPAKPKAAKQEAASRKAGRPKAKQPSKTTVRKRPGSKPR